MTHRNHNRLMPVFLCLIALITSGCFGGSNVRPETPAQRLAYVDARLTATMQTATDLRAAGIVGDGDWQEIKAASRDASNAMDLAWSALGGGNPDTALDYVVIANRLLLQIRAMLPEDGK